jgi:uncharacterized protein (DUF2267 family)
VNRGQFIHEIQRRGGFETAEEAEAALTATLSVLGERLTGTEATDLAAQLPDELADAVSTHGTGERFDAEEFYRRVAAREEAEIIPAVARGHVRTVVDVVLGAVSPGERGDVLAQLPEDLRQELSS